jgi:hypothetical protein
MNKLFARSRVLLAIVALATSAAMCTVSTARAATPTAGADGVSIGASHSRAASAASASSTTQCVLDPSQTCKSTDPTVEVNVYYQGDTSECLYLFKVSWGDGNISQIDVIGPPSNSFQHLGQHTYSTPGNYTITVSTAGSPGCPGNLWTDEFDLLAPAPAPATTNYHCSCVTYVRDVLAAHGVQLDGGPTTAGEYQEKWMDAHGWHRVIPPNNGTIPDGGKPMVMVWDAGQKGAFGSGHMAIVVTSWSREHLGASGRSPWYNYETRQWNITVLQDDWKTDPQQCTPAQHLFSGQQWGNLYGVNFYVPDN